MKRRNLNFCLVLCFFYFSCNTGASRDNTSESAETGLSKKSGDSTIKNSIPAFNYDVKKPDHAWKLPSSLVEVSGITWIDADHLILIEDLHPNLYYIKLSGEAAVLEKTIPFAAKNSEKIDIEDVALIGNTVYALWSHGILFKVSNWQDKAKVEQLNTGLGKENNTEGLCYDPVTKQLLIACKDDAGLQDEKKTDKAVYQFDITQKKLITPPFMVIRKKDFVPLVGEKLNFNPSAIGVHPITHDIYILTTRDNKGMAIFSHDGILKSYQEIEKDLMPQPEGICFSPDGRLFISSEGKQGESGNVFEFNSQSK